MLAATTASEIVEETPAPFLSTDVLERMRASAVALARSVRYENAGTVEFIYDCDRGEFYFLEMNTRIQVEHPVTEEISGIDLVCVQIRIADGAPFNLSQKNIVFQGHAIEARINAEAPRNNFRPSPGCIIDCREPDEMDIRIDTHCFPGYTVPPFYDSMIAKIIAHAPTREQAIEKLKRALNALVVTGIETTAPFVDELLSDSSFRAGEFNTGLVERHLRDREQKVALPRGIGNTMKPYRSSTPLCETGTIACGPKACGPA